MNQLAPYFMDVANIERNFGIGRRKIWGLLAARAITGSLVGGKWTVEVESVLRYLKRHKNTREENNV